MDSNESTTLNETVNNIYNNITQYNDIPTGWSYQFVTVVQWVSVGIGALCLLILTIIICITVVSYKRKRNHKKRTESQPETQDDPNRPRLPVRISNRRKYRKKKNAETPVAGDPSERPTPPERTEDQSVINETNGPRPDLINDTNGNGDQQNRPALGGGRPRILRHPPPPPPPTPPHRDSGIEYELSDFPLSTDIATAIHSGDYLIPTIGDDESQRYVEMLNP